ncbi:MAG TPA: site-specific integrase, partial [Chitinophagaceae bacterium]|nr:site-specific integrase [Chitinophagaceae bacterium]
MQDRIQAFLHFLEAEKGYAENTIAAYQNDLGQFFRHIQKKMDEKAENWAQVKKSVIVEYIERIKSGSYTSSTVARKVAAIKSFFHFLVAEGDLKEDPTLTLDSPKVKKRLPKAITLSEIDQLLQAPAGQNGPKAERDMALLEILYASGMRVTELVSLNVADIEINGVSGKVRVKGKKSNSKAREIPISGSALETLKTYLR